jgi:hypothetical protein
MLQVRCFSFCVIAGALFALVPACSEEHERTIYQELDLKLPEGEERQFDANNLVDDPSFTDAAGLDVAQIQKFLGKTPYDRPSFLETYQSNGVRAGDAIARAARRYKLNPLVFLVFAQTAQGLVGEQSYPFPTDRIEYVFNCGCFRPGVCIPEQAGFDRQVDCLGQRLRTSLDEMSASGQTSSGWGIKKTSSTLDGQRVTPANAATAAIYAETPRVHEEKDGGSWLFWNVWNLYVAGTDYAGPIGGGAGTGLLGDACVSDQSCGYEKGICATDYPGGLCTLPCTGECPQAMDQPISFCVGFPSGGFCLPTCNPGAPACRERYRCVRRPRQGAMSAADAEYVCDAE